MDTSDRIPSETLLAANALICARPDLESAVLASLTFLHEKRVGVPINEYLKRNNEHNKLYSIPLDIPAESLPAADALFRYWLLTPQSSCH
jgi:hypothetical protein